MRTETLLKVPEYATSFDIIISRAVSDLSTFVKSALPLLAKHGTIIAMKGEINTQELDAVRVDIPKDRYSLRIEKYGLPSINRLRSLVIIKRHH
jgi:16S rRNA G527 N7-methylase RsmG